MRAAMVFSRLSLVLGLSAAASVGWSFDSGSEPVYRLLPEIAVAGADLPDAAPEFVTADTVDGKIVLRWGRLFRVVGDRRVYGRFSGREVTLPRGADASLRLARSPNGRFLAVTSRGGTEPAGVRIFPISGDGPERGIDASDLPALSDAACSALSPSSPAPTAAVADAPPQAELLSASWSDDYVLTLTWHVPATEATADRGTMETTFQVMADGSSRLTGCSDAEAAPAARYTPQRDLVARQRTLTFVRLPVMAEPSGGARPSVLVAGPGPAFSAIDAGDPAVRAALEASQSYLSVVAAVPPPLTVATRQTAVSVRQLADTDTGGSARDTAIGLGRNPAVFLRRDRVGESRVEGGGENGSGG